MNNFKKLNIYNRHYTRNKKHPQRPDWFNYEKCFGNLLATTNFDLCNLTIIFEKEEDYPNYFIKKYEGVKPFKVKFIDTSEEKWIGKTNEKIGWARSIAAAAEVIKNDNLPENELLSIVDDDFLHTPNWVEVCLDYINNNLNGENWWVNPTDYGDRYYFVDENHTIDQYGTDMGMYAELTSKIRLGNYNYWRETPNALTSSIMPVKTFNRDHETYWKTGYSDCSLCNEIRKKYKTEFWNPMPGVSCHVIWPFYSPFVNWFEIQESIRIKI